MAQWVVPRMDLSGGAFWIVNDTGFPKKGEHSVGVARQYCGQLGKQDNRPVAVSVSLATKAASLPVAYRFYLPKDWAADRGRREKEHDYKIYRTVVTPSLTRRPAARPGSGA